MAPKVLLAQMGQRGIGRVHPHAGWRVVILLLIGLVLLALIAAVIALFVRSGRGPSAGALPPEGPVGGAASQARVLLDHRYAGGEIDTAEYQERRTALDA
jgi:putative membrane protein